MHSLSFITISNNILQWVFNSERGDIGGVHTNVQCSYLQIICQTVALSLEAGGCRGSPLVAALYGAQLRHAALIARGC